MEVFGGNYVTGENIDGAFSSTPAVLNKPRPRQSGQASSQG